MAESAIKKVKQSTEKNAALKEAAKGAADNSEALKKAAKKAE